MEHIAISAVAGETQSYYLEIIRGIIRGYGRLSRGKKSVGLIK